MWNPFQKKSEVALVDDYETALKKASNTRIQVVAPKSCLKQVEALVSLEVREPCLVSVVPEEEKYRGEDYEAQLEYDCLTLCIQPSFQGCSIECIGITSIDEVSKVVETLLRRNRTPIVASADVEPLLDIAGVHWLASLVAHDDAKILVDGVALLRAMNMILAASSASLSVAIPSMIKEGFVTYYDRHHLIFKGPGRQASSRQ